MTPSRVRPLFDVENLALETGATLEYADGRKFNTAGAALKRMRKAPMPAPAPAPAAPPAPAGLSVEMLQQILQALNRPVQVTLPDIPAPSVTVSAPAAVAPSPPTKWTFEFERNPNGTIKRIHATSKE